jgi:toxin-antitoxin system PIN domain toxin
LIAFMRISAAPRILERPLSIMAAWRQVDDWLAQERVWMPSATDRHPAVLAGLLPHCGPVSAMVHDAHLAALAIEHGLELCSADADFARFPGLRWRNPLAA